MYSYTHDIIEDTLNIYKYQYNKYIMAISTENTIIFQYSPRKSNIKWMFLSNFASKMFLF